MNKFITIILSMLFVGSLGAMEKGPTKIDLDALARSLHSYAARFPAASRPSWNSDDSKVIVVASDGTAEIVNRAQLPAQEAKEERK